MGLFEMIIIAGIPFLFLVIWKIRRDWRIEKNLNNAIVNLGSNLTDAGAIAFLDFIENAPLLNHPRIYNYLRAAWGMIRDARGISAKNKERIKIVLQTRGVVLR